MRTLIWIIASSCASFFSTNAVSQGFPSPQPGKAHELLAKDLGTWDCDVKMYFQGPEALPMQFKGVEVNQLVSGDLYLKTTFTCQMGERKFEGHSLTGYDPRTKRYVGTWVDNFTAVPSRIQGEYDESSKTYTERHKVQDESGTELEQKTVKWWIDSSTKKSVMFWIVQIEGKTQDIKIMEITAKRVGNE